MGQIYGKDNNILLDIPYPQNHNLNKEYRVERDNYGTSQDPGKELLFF